MFTKELLSEVLAAALAGGGDFADIFIEEKDVLGISCEDRKIERVHSGTDAGAGVRVVKEEGTFYTYTNDLTREGLLAAARAVGRAANGAKVRELREIPRGIPLSVSQPPGAVPVGEKVAVVLAAEKTARAVDERVRQVIVGYGDVTQKVTIANSDGAYVEDERVRTRFMVQVVAADGEILQTGYEAVGGFAGFELFEHHAPEDAALAAARRAVALLDAQPAPSGRMPVVLAGEAGGTMVHEACGHGLEADLVQKGLSVYAGKVGQQVAAPAITVIDDATLPGRYGSYAFDDEGEPARPVVLIRDGVLQDYLYDRLTAGRDGRSSNGHGRRESYQHKPMPRMGNTYIAPGKDDPQQIIRSVKRGLLVRKMGGGQVNTNNGDFVFEVAEGYLIEDGTVGPMVRGATLAGNGPEVLQRVEMVGNDLGFTIGTCGKDGQGVPVSDAQPTLLVPELVVGGTKAANGPEKRRIRRL